ncbi:hypothetical protein HOLleu_07813 [Holothuria leucospilota]|uniref:BED-type domain-containing protein n=1 Tax=Holothuria leucospilota TaxID=206669 RepID=A0A9Q1HD13_HOLLE|nr:hypothetical protein HOLleu_07813 [Holothuria leucospilota]
MNKGGRPKDPVWDSFESQTGKTVAKCRKCKAEVSAKTKRLKVHMTKCPALFKVTDSTGSDIEETRENNEGTSAVTDPEPPRPEQPPPKKAKLQQPVLTFGVKTDAKTKDKLDEQIAKMFYACNIPFVIVSHPEFRKMIDMLRPGYQPPTRQALSNELLDQIHEKITASVKENISGQDVTLMQDGWSDIHNTPVIASSIHVKEKSYFLSAVETGTNHKSAAYCETIARDSMEESLEKFGCNVTAIVTDNESKMKAK